MHRHGIRFPHVDALRGIAALSVLAYHCAFVSGALDDGGAGPWLAELNVGVVLFFAISGFLLYRPFVLARVAATSPPSLRAYASRRGLRLVPAYWVALTLITLATTRWEVFEPQGLLTYYGFLQSYRADTVTGGIGQAWTLGVEIAFYALLPVIAAIARCLPMGTPGVALRGEIVLLGALFALSIVWKLAVLGAVDPGSDRYLLLLIALPAQLDHFVLGMGLAVASVALTDGIGTGSGRLPGVARIVERGPALPWGVAAGAFVILGAGWHVGGEAGRVLGEHALQGVVALGLLTPAVIGAHGGGAVRRLLSRRSLIWVGLVSYGVYLWHLDILRELGGAGVDGWPLVAVGTALSLLAGAASWYGVERLALRRVRGS